MVSLERAAQCIGRRVKHVEGIELAGTVERVDSDVWVRTRQDDVVPCIPENLEWVSVLPSVLAQAIDEEERYEDAQIGYAPELYDEDYAGELVPNVSIVYSSDLANDDNERHPLYLLAPHMRVVYLLRINANPDIAREIEELLGWAKP